MLIDLIHIINLIKLNKYVLYSHKKICPILLGKEGIINKINMRISKVLNN